jgi:4-amino-4-deoxy-L-arabinose transferase-like glycosyltransferase
MRARDLGLLAALLAILLVWRLHVPPIGLHGEAREGLVVQDVVEHGRWVLPLRNGQLPSKPPLYHWLAASLAHGLGLSDAVLRLPSALAAIVLAGATLVLGTAIGGRLVGWLAVGALAGTIEFWLAATEARVDMLFAACVTLALVGFQRWYATGAASARALCWLAAAAAVLTKGPAGVVLPGLVIGVFLLWQRDLGRLRHLWSWPLAAALVAIDGGWYALAIRTGGREFVGVQLLYENVDRFLGRSSFARAAREPGFRHFALRMPVDFARHFLPWNLALPVAAARAWHGTREDASGRFLHAWWITILAFFTVASGKRAIYLLPLAPAIALLAARELARVPAWLARVRLPAAVRQQPAAALLVAVAVFDLAIAASAQGVHLYHHRRESLVDFAALVERIVPPDAPLYAAANLEPPAILVLAYRLDRPIVREPATCAGEAYVLVPDTARPRRDGLERLAASGRPRAPVSLARRRCVAAR